MEKATFNYPFSFDGCGVNDSLGQRLLTVSVDRYPDGRTRNPQADALGALAKGSISMLRALTEAEKSMREAIAGDPDAGKAGMKSPLYAAWSLAKRTLDGIGVKPDDLVLVDPEEEQA